jgi:putative solute:sodium symporter small subunit
MGKEGSAPKALSEGKGGAHVADKSSSNAYWAANIRIITICLVIWAIVSYGFGILLRPMLSGIPVGGTDLGFWFAQQGSILVFIALIFYYAVYMNRLDREHGVDEQ